MWSEAAREASRLFLALVESKLAQVLEVVKEYISECHFSILIGAIILIIAAILDLLWKWQGNKEKKLIDQQITEQMKKKGINNIDDNSDVDQ
jgi:hypothetical protein